MSESRHIWVSQVPYESARDKCVSQVPYESARDKCVSMWHDSYTYPLVGEEKPSMQASL